MTDADPLPVDGLDLRLEGLWPPQGRVQVLAFSSGRGFPHDAGQAVRAVVADAAAPRLRLRLLGLQTGALAIVAVHDPEGSGFRARDWLGRPLGGVAAAGAPPPGTGPAGFDTARVAHRLGGPPVPLRFHYARGPAGSSTLDPPDWLVRAWRLVFGGA